MKTKASGLRIYFTAIIIFLAIMAVILYIVHIETSSIVSGLILTQAETSNRALVNTLEELRSSALERAKIIANSHDIAVDVASGSPVLKKTLTNLSEGMDFASISDTGGEVMARSHSDERGDNILEHRAVSEALLSRGTATAIEYIDGVGLSVYASAAIFDEGRMIGVASCGFDLTSPELLDDFKNKNGCDATIYYGSERVNTTIFNDRGERNVGTTGNAEIIDTVLVNQKSYLGQVELYGRTYVGRFAPLMDDSQVIGILYTGADATSIQDSQRTMNYWIILIAFVGAVTALVLISAMTRFTRRFTSTLKELSSKEAALSTLTNILNGVEALIYVSDLETDEVIFVSDKMKDCFEILDDPMGKPCWEVFRSHTQNRCEYCPKYKLMENPGDPVIWDKYNELKDRHYRHNDSVIEWPDGRHVHLSEFYDITDIKRLQEDLLRMSSILHSSPNFVSYKKGTGECVFLNPAAEELTGYTHEELIEDYLTLLFGEYTADFLKHEVPLALEADGQINYELTGKRKNGEEIVFFVSTFEIDHEENAYGTVATDVTEKKRIECEKMAALAKAERASRVKSEFLSRMSHEMRTPMNAIIGMTGIARESKDLDKALYCLDKVDGAARHLLSIISDILEMTKIESGELELRSDEFDLKKLFEDIIDTTSFGSDKKEQSISLNIDQCVPSLIIGDKRRLGQVVSNLLSNAVKFTPDGGKIAVSVSVTEWLEDGVCTILTEVEDNGIGISVQSQEVLFSAFEQVDGGISRRHGGTGLGLAICKQIVDMMGGSIWVESELGKGSTFSFSIPVKAIGENCGIDGDSVTEAEGVCADDRVSCGDSRTVLVAEDVEINRIIVEEMLSGLDICVEFAVDGRQALEMYGANPEKYGLIIMDINMPEMDGLTATRQIRALCDPDAAVVPIIAMTANVFSEDIDSCLKAGMTDHIGKPIDPKELIDKLKRHMGI